MFHGSLLFDAVILCSEFGSWAQKSSIDNTFMHRTGQKISGVNAIATGFVACQIVTSSYR